MKKIIIFFIGLVMGFISIFGLIRLGREFNRSENINKTQIKKDTISDSLTVSNVDKYIKFLKIKHSEWVLKQVILESGWLKSYNTKARNNLTGFKTSKGYIIFANWKECLKTYKSWQDKYYRDTTEEYSKFITRIGYAEAIDYVETINKMKIDESYYN